MNGVGLRSVSCLAVMCLAGCGQNAVAPRTDVTYELIAVNGRSVPVTIADASDLSYRFISEQLRIVSPTRVRSRQVAAWGSASALSPWELEVEYDLVTRGDSSRFDHRCPANARCAIPPRVGPAVFADTLELQEVRGTTVTLRFVRRP